MKRYYAGISRPSKPEEAWAEYRSAPFYGRSSCGTSAVFRRSCSCSNWWRKAPKAGARARRAGAFRKPETGPEHLRKLIRATSFSGRPIKLALHQVLQLANVSRPVVSVKNLQGIVGKAFHISAGPSVTAGNHMAEKMRKILLSLA